MDARYLQVSRPRFARREADPAALSILDVITMDSSDDLLLLLQSNSPSTTKSTTPMPQKDDNEDKNIRVMQVMKKVKGEE